MSDHLPLVVMLKQTKLLNKEPIIFTSRCLDDKKLQKANHKLMHKDWIGLLTGTMSNPKFNQFCDMVNKVLDEIAPLKTVKISLKRRYVEAWVTRGLEEASRTKIKLYKKSLQKDSTEDDHIHYKQHQNIYNTLKRKIKQDYYQDKCRAYRNNSKKLWALINQTITKVKHKGSIIPHITANGIKVTKPKLIANNFGKFYSSVGSKLAKKIVPGMTSVEDYISNIPVQRDSIVLKQVTPLEIDNIIRKLPNKSSSDMTK